MADVTRWEIVTFAWRDRPSDDVMEQDDDGLWVKYADHLATLERVRVETLREIRAAIQSKRDHWQARAERADEDSMVGRRYRDYFETHDADLAAIDRLINAATTGDTDD